MANPEIYQRGVGKAIKGEGGGERDGNASEFKTCLARWALFSLPKSRRGGERERERERERGGGGGTGSSLDPLMVMHDLSYSFWHWCTVVHIIL